MPSAEALVVEYLKADASIAALVGTRVSTELPSTPTFPLLTVTLFGGIEKLPRHLHDSYVQLLAWGRSSDQGGKADADLLIRTAQAVMLEADTVAHSRGVVTYVRTVQDPRWFPDDAVTPSRPRYLCEVSVTVHPHPL